MSNVTLKIIAQELSLSVATVSKALADSHEISQSTKDVVKAAALRMGYVVNTYASSLRKRQSKTIAVVLPEIADSFFAQAINGIEQVAQSFGYHVLIYLTHESLLREMAIMQDFKSGRVDGILISVSEDTTNIDHIRAVAENNIPIVFFDRVCEELNMTCVVTNDEESSFNATLHLKDKMCKNVGFIGISASLLITRNRIKGYQSAIQKVSDQEEQILICGKDVEENYQLVAQLLSGPNRPDGLILSVEKLTTLVYRVCEDLKINIPQQLKVLTFTNFGMAQFLNPPLTTINQPAYEMGRTAATTLFKKLKNTSFVECDQMIVIPSHIVYRKSSE